MNSEEARLDTAAGAFGHAAPGPDNMCKRIIDLTLSAIGLLIAAPIMAAIAVLVWLDSPGPVFFAQQRLGLHGQLFWLYKFRKFPANWSGAGPHVTTAGDIRMTRIGAILERTKLDELPQLWNILRGDMSFVGPRPESTHFADLFEGQHAAVLGFRPGLFGPAIIRNESQLYPAEESPEAYYRRVLFKLKADRCLAYHPNANCLTDMIWILRGVAASLLGTLNTEHVIRSFSKILILDVTLAILAWMLANVFCFSGLPSGDDFRTFVAGLWLVPLVIVSGLFIGGCYRHPLPYFCFSDAIRLVTAASAAWAVACLCLLGKAGGDIPMSLLAQGWLVLIPALASPRVAARFAHEHQRVRASRSRSLRQVLIYGCGNEGRALARWMGSTTGLRLLGFLDDNSRLQGGTACGYHILGRESDIATIASRYRINEIWVTFQAEAGKRDRLQALCQQHQIKVVFPSDLGLFAERTPPAERQAVPAQTALRDGENGDHISRACVS
jgi:lipopolysaccharide/colanic/teichoic acid biosynthesis glycosyltransferase